MATYRNYGDSAFNSPVVPREASIQCTQLTPRALALWLPSYCMARLARVVVSGHPHHVTQRGNGRARTSSRASVGRSRPNWRAVDEHG